MAVYGGIEAGGTKFVVGAGTGPLDLRKTTIPTTTPAETMALAIAWLKEQGELAAIGVASFGPIDLDKKSPRWGYITSTPKEHWRDTDMLSPLREAFGRPLAFDTDVNAAAMAENRWGAAAGLMSCLYLTIGTGIGGGLIVNGQPLQGLGHPEMGHIRVPRQANDGLAGICPFHRDCLEGLASGPAIKARWGTDGANLAPEHDAWRMESSYLAAGIANLVCTLAPACVVLGGGVMRRKHLFDLIRRETASLLNGYREMPPIVPPGLGADSGIAGAIALAELRYHTDSNHVMEI